VRKHLVTDVDIDATPAQVWAVLSDLAAYREWNPFIVDAEGTAEVGTQLTLRMQPQGGRALTLRPTVLESRAGDRLRWRGKVGVRGILDADHRFTIEARDGGVVQLRQEETFSGVLVPFLARSLDRGTLPAFQAMNEALKERVERCRQP
jgi:hypothetical protein